VVGLEGGPHVEAGETVRADEAPVGPGTDDLALQPLAGELTARDIEDQPRSERAGAHLVECQIGVVGHLLDEFRHRRSFLVQAATVGREKTFGAESVSCSIRKRTCTFSEAVRGRSSTTWRKSGMWERSRRAAQRAKTASGANP